LTSSTEENGRRAAPKSRPKLEAMQEQEKKNKEEYRATMSTLTKGNVKRK